MRHHHTPQLAAPQRPWSSACRPSHWLAGLATAVMLSSTHAAPLVIDIAAPAQSDWTQTVLQHVGATTVTASTRNAAAAETGKWRIDFVKPPTTTAGSSADSLALIYALQGWDPASDGGIGRIDVTMGLQGFISSFGGGIAGAIRPVVQQDGQIYSVFGSGVTITTDTALPTTWSLLNTDNWVRIDGTIGLLDLTAAGDPLLFGLRFDLGTTCSGAAGCSGANTSLLADQIRFSISPAATAASVPEPGSLALVMAGLWVMGSAARRRKSAAVPA